MAFPRLTETQTSPAAAGLSATERCDACGAPGLAKAYGASGAVLVFCRHHAEASREKLQEQGFTLETFYGALESSS